LIFIDRSVPKPVADALMCVRNDVEWLEPRYPQDAKDATTWLPDAGKNGWLVIARDKKIRTRAAERQAIIDNGVGAFIIIVKKNLNRWEYLRLIATNLDEMEEVFAATPKPFIWTVETRGLSRKKL
jgi:hypothetical protein